MPSTTMPQASYVIYVSCTIYNIDITVSPLAIKSTIFRPSIHFHVDFKATWDIFSTNQTYDVLLRDMKKYM